MMKRSFHVVICKFSMLFSSLLVGGLAHAQQNIFSPANVVAITSTPANNNLDKLNNGNTSSSDYIDFFTSDPVKITFELKTASVLKTYQVYFYSSGYAADSVKVSASNDGSDWYLLDTGSADASLVSGVVSNAGAYRFYQFIFTGIHNEDLSPLEIMADNGVLVAPELTIAPQERGDQAVLSWMQVMNANGISTGKYEVQRSKDGTNFSPLTTIGGANISYTDTGLARSTSYWYMVRALLPDQSVSSFSNVVKITTTDDTLRSAPALGASADLIQSNIAHLSWSLIIGGPGGFDVERSVDGTNFTRIQRLDKSVASFNDSSLLSDTKYWYRVRAYNDISVSPYSDSKMITSINDSLLAAPVLNAVAITAQQAQLSWTQTPLSNDADATRNKQSGFQIERSTDGINFTPLGLNGRVNRNTMSFADETLSANTHYWYRVSAFNYLGTSPYSVVVEVTTTNSIGTLVDITDDGGRLSASADNWGGPTANEGSLKLIDNNLSTKWLVFNSEVSGDLSAVYKPTGSYVITSYAITTGSDAPGRDPGSWRVEGSADSTNWTLLDNRSGELGYAVPRGETVKYLLAQPGTIPYKYYRITFTGNNNSSDGVRFQVAEWQIFGISSSMLDVPGALSVSGTTLSGVALQWQKISPDNVSMLELQRSGDGLYFQTIDSLTPDKTSFTDQLLYDSATYFYRIRSVGQSVTDLSGWSNVVKATTSFVPGVPLGPVDLSLLLNSDTIIGLSWIDRSYNETVFEVERSLDSITFTPLRTLPANTTAFADSSVRPGTYFYYRVRAKNTQGVSAYSFVLKVLSSGQNTTPLTTLPVIPGNLCTGAGTYRFSFSGISAGPAYESIQKLRVSNVVANRSPGDTLSAKLLTQFTFDPAVNNGVVNYGFATTGSAKAGDSAIIIVTIKDDGGTNSFGVDSVEVPVKFYFVPFSVSITSDKDTSVPRYALVTLKAASNFPGTTTYQWANADGIEGSTSSLVLRVRPTRATTYTVTATSSGGCQATSSITIAPPSGTVRISNVLTPNGDGKNDRWIIWGIENKPDNSVKVFDRAGRLIYSQRNYSNNWDGRYQGKLLEEGAYYYVVDFGDGQQPATGMLNIIHAH
ncbi:MAG: hypothetical protein DI535_04850 [Citrobacter freundii]|nr:MAG: hypothetical protein DI535_04850 [Citrobacter freundii]